MLRTTNTLQVLQEAIIPGVLKLTYNSKCFTVENVLYHLNHLLCGRLARYSVHIIYSVDNLAYVITYLWLYAYNNLKFKLYRSIGIFIEEENGALKFAEGNYVCDA